MPINLPDLLGAFSAGTVTVVVAVLSASAIKIDS